MSSAAIQEALDAYLLPRVPDGMPVAWEGVPFTPPAGQPWIATQMLARAARHVGPGANSVEEIQGSYQVAVFFPSGLGVRGVCAKADEIAALFRRGMSLATANGLQVLILGADAPPVVSQPGWVMVPVQINWLCYAVPSS